MIIPEYGRHIQDLVNHATQIENKEERNEMVRAIVDVMGQLNPHLRDVSDFTHKLWDHVYIMSDFKLDVDSPYPKPEPEHFQSKPRKMPYPEDNIRFKHYGKGVEKLVSKAVEMEEGEEKEALILSIANLMKKHYLSWSRNTVDDKIIWLDLNKIARGKLKLDENTSLISTKEIALRADVNGNGSSSNNKKGGKKKKRKPFKKKKY
tara:strand:- start:39545 stop:40162 length:618 start_codon:yes stop_codon:yes gene_type:complete